MRTKIVLPVVVATTLICANVSYGQNSPAPAASGSPIDATLFTTYTIDTAHTDVSFIVCGSTQNTSGCYASGNLGPFGKVGALMEGNPKTDLSTNTVTRAIYVLDFASGSNLNEVELSAAEYGDDFSRHPFPAHVSVLSADLHQGPVRIAERGREIE